MFTYLFHILQFTWFRQADPQKSHSRNSLLLLFFLKERSLSQKGEDQKERERQRIFFFKNLFICGGGGVGWGGSTSKRNGRGRSRPPAEQGAAWGALSHDPGIMTWADLTDWVTEVRQRQSLKQATHPAWCGAWSHDPEIMTQADIKSWMPNWLSHPDSPQVTFS